MLTSQHVLEMAISYLPRCRTRTRPRPLHNQINLFLQRRQSIFLDPSLTPSIHLHPSSGSLPTAPAPAPAHSQFQLQPPSPRPYKDTPSPALASNNSNKPVSPPDSASSSDDSSDMLRRCVICPGSRSVASYIHNCIFHSRKRVSRVWEGVVWFWFLGLIDRLDMDPGGGGASYLGVCHPRVTRSLLKRVKSS